jgi:SagB-type dehydrogenase family enzyme
VPRIELPLAADAVVTAFAAIRQGQRPDPYPLTRDTLAILFELSLGLSAWKQHGNSRWALRCNPSSGNLHPTEGYLICPELPNLSAGVYHYLSHDHVLERRATPTSVAWAAPLKERVLIALTGIHWREAWKYGLRAYRYCQHDCGHAIAAIAYAAAALGWQARLLSSWSDQELAALLGLDRIDDFKDAELEHPEIALVVGPRLASESQLSPLGVEELVFSGHANRLSRWQRPWPGLDDVDHAAQRPRTPLPLLQLQVMPPLATHPNPVRAATLTRQRRSAVAYDGVSTLAADRWFAMLDALLPRCNVPPLDSWPWPPRIHPVLFTHRIAGIASGLYLLVRDPNALPELQEALQSDWEWVPAESAPAHLPLYRLTGGDAREAARTIACHQDIAADSCFAVGFLGCFADSLQETPWAYRELFWETGLLGQILYLEAEAAGMRATGIGCFFDDALHRLLGIDSLSWQVLYQFTVGGAIEDQRLQTLPPYIHLDRPSVTLV